MDKKSLLAQLDSIYDIKNELESKIQDLIFILMVIDDKICNLRADIEDIEED